MFDGILLINKPSGPTSHDVVNIVRRKFKTKKVGHLGTLDPLATGLLIVAIGKATKTAQTIVKDVKEYEFKLKLGISTETDDLAGKTVFEKELPSNCIDKLKSILPKFIGSINQIPPNYSAIKKNGKKLYELARQGIEVKPDPRPVEIFNIDILEINLPSISMRMSCSSGTYVRSVCRDIGLDLGCGGVANDINRTKIGEYILSNAITLDKILSLDFNDLHTYLQTT